MVEYDATRGARAPEIDVITLENGDQQVMADGRTVATLIDPILPLAAEEVLVVGPMAA